jgi:type II secretory pathway pseudopilin PulG
LRDVRRTGNLKNLMRRAAAFTLIEIMLAVMVTLMVIFIAVPSISGVVSDNHRRESFQKFDDIARTARTLSVREQRAYVLSWERSVLVLRPELPLNTNEANGVSFLQINKDENYDIELPAALATVAQKAWMFWPSGTCEPANIFYKGSSGSWTARYDPLTVQADFSME